VNEPKRRVAVYENIRDTPNGPTRRVIKNTGDFHGWFQVVEGIDAAGPVAVVEYAGGEIELVEPRMICFETWSAEGAKTPHYSYRNPGPLLFKLVEQLKAGAEREESECIRAWCRLLIGKFGV